MNENDFDKKYVETLAVLRKNLFQDFLSELSRKRQLFLLSTATITILIAFTIVTPIETALAGIKFTFTNTQVLPLLSGSITLYFLLLYAASVMKDLQYAKHVELPSQYEYMMAIQQMEDDLVSQFLDLAPIRDEQVQHTMDYFKAEINWEQSQNKKLATMADAISKMRQQGKSEDEIIKFIKESEREIDIAESEHRSHLRIRKQHSDPLWQKAQIGLDNQKILEEKVRIFRKTYNGYKLWRNVVVFIEIIFPISLGIFAVGIAMWVIF